MQTAAHAYCGVSTTGGFYPLLQPTEGRAAVLTGRLAVLLAPSIVLTRLSMSGSVLPRESHAALSHLPCCLQQAQLVCLPIRQAPFELCVYLDSM